MPILSKLTRTFPTALLYITVGTLITIWTLVYWIFNSPESKNGYLWVVGFLLTGLSVSVIGLILGKISREDRAAERPTTEVTPTAVQFDLVTARQVTATVPAVSSGVPIPGTPAVDLEPTAPSTNTAPPNTDK